jgi:Ca-activated chloride channel family protein
LYEIVPPGVVSEINNGGVDPLKYQRPETPPPAMVPVRSDEMMTVKVRYKHPDGDTSRLVSVPVLGRHTTSARHLGFAASVAQFGMLLRDSPFKGDATWTDVVRLAKLHRGEDRDGYRAEFIRLVELAAALDRQRSTTAPLSMRR